MKGGTLAAFNATAVHPPAAATRRQIGIQ